MKYSGPKCRLCRREGVKLFLKGDKCSTAKCILTKRNTPPGQHTRSFGKPTEYARQLREKQKAKRIYNVTETQFSSCYKRAVKKKGAITGDLLLKLLETRFDNILYRVGLADSRSQARQLISHGLFKLNGKRVTVPSIELQPEDTFEIIDRMKNMTLLASKKGKKEDLPSWVTFDFTNMKGSIARDLVKEELPTDINAQLIVEYYSR